MADQTTDDIWHFAYWYPSNDHAGEDVSEYEVQCRPAGKALIFESLPTNDGSYMFARLVLHDEVYSGAWHETTSPSGAFKSAQYSGSGQLLMSKDGNKLEGMWAGAGFDHDTKKMRIYNGKWLITRSANS